ncbi:hypothetical protein AVEN_263335-1 [Araneus ventricosus]|uniref:Uncharacterized protein n=1 Tax=Araneus ventricosus TaxID=182803 RepID=A0A4Y2D279_ARAVE|nr:hypothetical protein AVEN_263335-1 [Araneus ventricosus]
MYHSDSRQYLKESKKWAISFCCHRRFLKADEMPESWESFPFSSACPGEGDRDVLLESETNISVSLSMNTIPQKQKELDE